MPCMMQRKMNIIGKAIVRRALVFVVASAILCAVHDRPLSGQINENTDIILSGIRENASGYGGKTVTMTMKYKNTDRIFSTITFYDRKNQDISFDISIQQTMIEYQRDMLNLHEGLDYLVTFIVNGVDATGFIDGELIRFTPLILTLIPEGKRPEHAK